MPTPDHFLWAIVESPSVYHAREATPGVEGSSLCGKWPMLYGGTFEPDLTRARQCASCLRVIAEIPELVIDWTSERITVDDLSSASPVQGLAAPHTGDFTIGGGQMHCHEHGTTGAPPPCP